MYVAVESVNSSICYLLDSEKDTCIYSVAEKAGNISLCEKIQDADFRDGCYYKVAEVLVDPNVCVKIKDSDYRQDCVTKLRN